LGAGRGTAFPRFLMCSIYGGGRGIGFRPVIVSVSWSLKKVKNLTLI
jgi:hypothetical protein